MGVSYGHKAGVARLKMKVGFQLAVIQITNEIVSDRHETVIQENHKC